MLVRTAAAALNPADWTDVDYAGGYEGCTVGLDYAGTVVAVAPGGEMRKTFKKGDRVCGPVHGCNSSHGEDGAFAGCIIVKADLQMHVPDHLSFEDAATLGCGILTVGQGLYQSLGLGTLAIQFAKLSGYKVVTTCSRRNFDLVRGLGADVVLDYRDPDCSAQIRAATSDSLLHIFDTIATPETAAIGANAVATVAGVQALSPPGIAETGTTAAAALYACTLDPVLPSPAGLAPITKKSFLAYITFGEAFWFEGDDFLANKAGLRFCGFVTGLAEGLLEQRKIRAYPVRLGLGFEGVLDGLGEMRRGAVTGQKLVYRL